MSDKIILMGFMGCGKSTIGNALAKKIAYDFVDLDDEIEKTAKMTISKIFETKGEKHFRKLESSVLIKMLNSKKNLVLALGGGTPCYHSNLKLMRKYNSFYIKCGVEVLTKRLRKEKSHRPIVADKKPSELKTFIKQKLGERNKFYNQASHVILGARPIKKVVTRITTLAKK